MKFYINYLSFWMDNLKFKTYYLNFSHFITVSLFKTCQPDFGKFDFMPTLNIHFQLDKHCVQITFGFTRLSFKEYECVAEMKINKNICLWWWWDMKHKKEHSRFSDVCVCKRLVLPLAHMVRYYYMTYANLADIIVKISQRYSLSK